MTHEDVQAWLDRYVEAWLTYNPELIASLFSEDVEYRYHPADEPIVGRPSVVASWLEPEGGASGRDTPGTYDARYRPWAIDGRRVVAVGESRYYTDATRSTLERTYDNCFLLEYDEAGQCRAFTEFYRLRS